jgi:hypothetical protein
MERDPSSESREPLRKLMREWKASEPLPPRFQEAVWRRIEGAQARETGSVSVWQVMGRWIETVLPRPALATAYVAVLLIAGVTAGWTQADQKTARLKDELGQRYIRVLDPYQAPRQ